MRRPNSKGIRGVETSTSQSSVPALLGPARRAHAAELLDRPRLLAAEELDELVRRIARRTPHLWRPLDRGRPQSDDATSCSTKTTESTCGCCRGCRASGPGSTTTTARRRRHLRPRASWTEGALAIGGDARAPSHDRPASAAAAPAATSTRSRTIAGEPAVSIHAYSPPLTASANTGSTSADGCAASPSTDAKNSRTQPSL